MTSNQLTTTPEASALAEQVAIVGDLSQLTAQQRMAYYGRVCESLGINPLTQPFQYIKLNGKLVLYATRTAADQLRRLNGVSLNAPHIEFTDGLCIVTITGNDATGRTDTEIGAVAINNLAGEARANAIMKAITKAKRRLTLSICGLGWLDETEVETIPSARPVTVTADGEIVDGVAVETPKPAHQPSSGPMPDDEVVIFESPAGDFLKAAASLIGEDTDYVKDRMSKLGYSSISGKAAERVKLYRTLRDEHDATQPAQVNADDTAGQGAVSQEQP
jgi:hypothetical protein